MKWTDTNGFQLNVIFSFQLWNRNEFPHLLWSHSLAVFACWLLQLRRCISLVKFIFIGFWSKMCHDVCICQQPLLVYSNISKVKSNLDISGHEMAYCLHCKLPERIRSLHYLWQINYLWRFRGWLFWIILHMKCIFHIHSIALNGDTLLHALTNVHNTVCVSVCVYEFGHVVASIRKSNNPIDTLKLNIPQNRLWLSWKAATDTHHIIYWNALK